VLVAAFSEGMVEEGGYKDVVNIDISSVVIDAMQKKYCDRPQLKCILMIMMNNNNTSCCMHDFKSLRRIYVMYKFLNRS
jgi:hypothetical protein